MTAQIESTNEYMNSKLGRSFICHTNIFGLPIHWWRPATNKKTKDGREALARANNDYQIRTSESRRDFRLTTNERTQRCCQNMFAQHTPNRVYYYRTGCCLYCLRIAHNKLCERIFLLKASIRAGVLDGLQHEQKSARAYIHRHIHHRVNRSYERARYAGAAQCNCFRLGSPTVQSTAHIVNSTYMQLMHTQHTRHTELMCICQLKRIASNDDEDWIDRPGQNDRLDICAGQLN